MNKTIYIHIGPQKTGTTSLTNFFLKNENLLLSFGYKLLYSKISSYFWMIHNGQQIPEIFNDFYFSDNIEFPNGIPYQELKQSYSDNLQQIKNEDYQKYLLFTDFYLCSCPKKNFDDIAQYQKVFTCSVREQVSFYQSYYSELLKCPNVDLTKAELILSLKFLDYLDIREKYSDIPNSKIIFIPYHFLNNTEQYMEILKLKSKLLKPNSHDNLKLPNSAVDFLFSKKMNIDQKKWKLFITIFQKKLMEVLSVEQMREKEGFYKPEILEKVFSMYEENNKKIISFEPQLKPIFKKPDIKKIIYNPERMKLYHHIYQDVLTSIKN